MFKRAILILLFVSLTTSAKAIEIQNINGHDVQLNKRNYETVLKVDGREMLQEQIISFDEMTTVSGVPVLIGSTSPGGNACDGSGFILSVPIGQKAKLDGPIDTCTNLSYEVEDDRIVFKSPNIPGEGQDTWEWTSTQGFKSLGKVAFAAEDDSGWDALREQKIGHPGDVFDNIEISSKIKNLLGNDFEKYQAILTGVGSGEYKNGNFVGMSCTPHMCTDEEAVIFLSHENKEVYAAFKPSNQNIKVFPAVRAWPENAKIELRKWSRKWK